MAERYEAGILDTCTYIDLHQLDPASLPAVPRITAITMAELHQGVAMATDASVRGGTYGTLVAMTIEAKGDPKPRRMDLMIAAIASPSSRSDLARAPGQAWSAQQGVGLGTSNGANTPGPTGVVVSVSSPSLHSGRT